MIGEQEKKEVLNKVASEAKFSDYFVDFINILIDQDRLVSADSIFETFELRYCELTDTQVISPANFLYHLSFALFVQYDSA